MGMDLQGSLRVWAFLVVLTALFVAAIFRPHRIRNWPLLWVAAGLLATILFLDCVAPLFFSPSAFKVTVGGAMSTESLTSEIRDYLTVMKIIAVVQHCGLAAAILVGFIALYDGRAASGRRPTATETAGRGRHRSEESPPAARPRLPEDACLSCGQRMPIDADKCPACGWTWGSDDASSG